jgi:hypothetical protein
MSPSTIFRGAVSRGAVSRGAVSRGAVLCGALVSLVLVSCSSSSSSSSSGSSSSGGPTVFPSQPPATKLFTKAFTDVVVEVDYADGAAPFVGPQGQDSKGQGGVQDIWGLLTTNVSAIFEIKQLTVPNKLSAMEALTDVEAKNYNDADILAVAKAHRDTLSDDTTASYYILFLNGNYIDADGNVDEDRLGVSIGAEGVIAMFKPAILKPAGKTIPPPAYVEQLAMVHEFGHAVGFVDNGVPVEDANKAHIADGHHCTNTACAMNGVIDTVQGAAPFAMTQIRSQSAVLIGQECLSDARILVNNLNP